MPSAPSRQAWANTVAPPRRCVGSARCRPWYRAAAAPAASRRRSSLNRDKPSGPSTTASPSLVKLLALINSAAAAIGLGCYGTDSTKAYSCWASRIISDLFPSRSPTTKLNPLTVGSIEMKDVVPSSFLREATELCHLPKSKIVKLLYHPPRGHGTHQVPVKSSQFA
jgi:hypothetical protein